jgi:hypothetical protein
VAFGVLRGQLAGILRRAAYVVLAAALVMIVTGVYHLGYQQFREDGIAGPETGNIIISVPQRPPVGSVSLTPARGGRRILGMCSSAAGGD